MGLELERDEVTDFATAAGDAKMLVTNELEDTEVAANDTAGLAGSFIAVLTVGEHENTLAAVTADDVSVTAGTKLAVCDVIGLSFLDTDAKLGTGNNDEATSGVDTEAARGGINFNGRVLGEHDGDVVTGRTVLNIPKSGVNRGRLALRGETEQPNRDESINTG